MDAFPLPSQYKAILFDHDGTLIDSESVHLTLWRETLGPFGVTLTDAFYNDVMAGIPVSQNARDVVSAFSLSVSPQELAKIKQHKTKAYLQQQAFDLMPGASAVIQGCLHAGLTLAIVTGGPRYAVERTIHCYGFQGAFSAVVAVEDVQHSKPAPDCYRKALSILGLTPDQAMAIEDTEHGLTAAVKAGLRCVAIPTAQSVDHDFSASARQYTSLSDWFQSEIESL